MKTMKLFLMISILFSCGAVVAQTAKPDTLSGILRTADQKVAKRIPVTLGKVTKKTSSNGVFEFPNANLQDTLKVWSAKEKKQYAIPVNGYNYLTVTLKNGAFDTKGGEAPDPELQKILEREHSKMISSDKMDRAQIQKLHCEDLYCVLQHMSGVYVNGTAVNIRASMSFNSGTDPLIVVDGIPMQDISILGALPIQTIEEVTVLKDGAEYGARGANGVIKIKTAK